MRQTRRGLAKPGDALHSSPMPRRPTPVARTRRVVNTVIGALGAGAAGAAAVWLAAPPDRVAPWIIAIMALLGAGLGYRHGRGVATAAGKALLGAAID